MNKTELKNFAVSARRELLEKVALRAKIFGIDNNSDLNMEEQFGQVIVNGIGYPIQMKFAFQSLASRLKIKGYEQLLEEVAYTWFNRIIAIRYMEVHEYLPSRVNILSSKTGKAEPDILNMFETVDLDVDVPTIKDFIHLGKIEEAYRKLFKAQCNALNNILPYLFEKINDYSELLLPDFLLDSESVISKLTKNEVLTESFQEVEVIGWLYQFYNSEPKDKVFTNLKKNKKIEKYDIPAATQLFTPKWIVKYMVENSLGHLWMEANPSSLLKENMKYYIEPAKQEEHVKKQLSEKKYKNSNLEEIKLIDPCVGSGHILVYAFDLFYQMYEEAGYPTSDIPQLVLEKNLYGLDIDSRATQLASFALMMKAREKSIRIFRKKVEINIFPIIESNHFNKEGIVNLLGHNEVERGEISCIIEDFFDAKNYGSIIQTPIIDYQKYIDKVNEIGEIQLSIEYFKVFEQLNEFIHLLQQAKLLSAKYDVAITNPPYMGFKGMNEKLVKYLKSNYQSSKGDLFAVFIERVGNFIKPEAFGSLITMESWMFLNSFSEMRRKLLDSSVITNFIHMPYDGRGRTSLGINFGTSAFIFRNDYNSLFKATYQCIRYFEIDSEGRPNNFPVLNERYNILSQTKFYDLPGAVITYWITENTRLIFLNNGNLYKHTISASQNVTGNNNRFLRYFWEVNIQNHMFNGGKWRSYAKGGGYKRWYGNLLEVIDWSPSAREIYRTGHASQIIPEEFWYKKGITWGLITNAKPSFRVLPEHATFDKGGSSIFVEDSSIYNVILGLLNSKVGLHFLGFLAPTLNYQVRDIRNIPIIDLSTDKIQTINIVVEENIGLVKQDWDSFETSMDFKKHPFITNNEGIRHLNEAYKKWVSLTDENFNKLHSNEERLNDLLIDVYDLNAEINSEVSEQEISIRRADRIRDTKSFLSYFIGCLLGRFSLEVGGLSFAGGDWDENRYKKFKPNKYGLIQLTDEHYFDDDIISGLMEFLSLNFGAETVDKNLQWLAESLELKRDESVEERLRRYFLDEFFKDHCQVYQKRPIYWLVDSGKQKGLRTLIYMHRYQSDTMATIRFEHLQEIQAKYHYEISAVEARIVNPNLSATEKRDLEKRKTDFQKRLDELLEFDKKLAEYANAQISIDLDDGVNVNYQKFEKVLAKIK